MWRASSRCVVFDQESMSIAFQGRAVTPLQSTTIWRLPLFKDGPTLRSRRSVARRLGGGTSPLKTRRIDSQVSRFRRHLQILDCPYEIVVIPNEGYLLHVTPSLGRDKDATG